MPYLIAYYEECHGEYGASGEVVIPFTETEAPQDAIHEYFCGFYGKSTETVEQGEEYSDGGIRGLVVSGHTVLPPDVAEVLTQYMTVAHREEVAE